MNEFEMKAYLAQYGSNVVTEPEAKEEITEKQEHEAKIYTNWQEFNQALENGKIAQDDEIHEPFGDKYSVTEMVYVLGEENDELKIEPKCKYEKIK